MPLFLPDYYTPVRGIGRGMSPLAAFENALLKAGIEKYNLIKVSSILPPKCKRKEVVKLPAGALLPIAYSYVYSIEQCDVLTSAIAIALPENEEEHGLIMEYHGFLGETDALGVLSEMVDYSARNRSVKFRDVEYIVCSTSVHDLHLSTGEVACVFCGVALHYEI